MLTVIWLLFACVVANESLDVVGIYTELTLMLMLGNINYEQSTFCNSSNHVTYVRNNT